MWKCVARIFTSSEKEGMKGSNKHARRYTSPAEVLITMLQEGLSALYRFQNCAVCMESMINSQSGKDCKEIQKFKTTMYMIKEQDPNKPIQ